MPDPTPPEPPQGHTAPRIPDHLPLSMQDINLMRCTTCGTLLTGSWPITKQDARAGQAAVQRVRDLADDMRHITGARAWADLLDTALNPKDTPPAQHTPGSNAEDCPACTGRRDLPYPFICPGTDPKDTE